MKIAIAIALVVVMAVVAGVGIVVGSRVDWNGDDDDNYGPGLTGINWSILDVLEEKGMLEEKDVALELETMKKKADSTSIQTDNTITKSSPCAIRHDGVVFCIDSFFPDTSIQLCGDINGTECSLWLEYTDGADGDKKKKQDDCCDVCANCPPGCSNAWKVDCSNALSSFPKVDCGVCPDDPTSNEVPVQSAPMAATTQPKPGDYSTHNGKGDNDEIAASKCLKFDGADVTCVEADGDKTACIELGANKNECNFWFILNSTQTELCCQGCALCPSLGCENPISIDCSNLADGLSIDCLCE